MTGIYIIKNKLDNSKIYIGSSFDFNKRIRKHKNDLINGKHHNKKLQRAFNKYGDIFEYELIENCDKDLLLEKEQFYIDKINPFYNHHKLVGGHNRSSTTEETSLKIRESKEKFMKKVYQFDLNGNLLNEFKCLSDAMRFLNKKTTSKIIDCCKLRRNTAYGFKWSYTDTVVEYVNPKGNRVVVEQYDLKNNFIKEWKSFNEISTFLNISATIVQNFINNKTDTRNKYLKNYIWKIKK